MIKIHNGKKGGYFIQHVARNGEILAHSQILKSRQAVKKNLKAMLKEFGITLFYRLEVLDCTGEKPKKITI